MGFKCGIVGLPNVGKSTLFNALTKTAAAQAANYPFCTIEPNTGEVAVPDPRLDRLAVIGKSAQIVPTRLTFVDIAGLGRGASKGETELMLADLDSLERRVVPLKKRAGGDKEVKLQVELMEAALALLRDGKPARRLKVSADDRAVFDGLNLLTSKPVLYDCNVEE